jgi:hypothetical protein
MCGEQLVLLEVEEGVHGLVFVFSICIDIKKPQTAGCLVICRDLFLMVWRPGIPKSCMNTFRILLEQQKFVFHGLEVRNSKILHEVYSVPSENLLCHRQ